MRLLRLAGVSAMNPEKFGVVCIGPLTRETRIDAAVFSVAARIVLLVWCPHEKFAVEPVLEPVHNLFRISVVKASTTICRLVLSFLSQFFQSRRHFCSQAKDRSTTHRFGRTTKV